MSAFSGLSDIADFELDQKRNELLSRLIDGYTKQLDELETGQRTELDPNFKSFHKFLIMKATGVFD